MGMKLTDAVLFYIVKERLDSARKEGLTDADIIADLDITKQELIDATNQEKQQRLEDWLDGQKCA